MLSERELTASRATIRATLTSSATIERPGKAKSPTGSNLAPFTQTATGVPCRVGRGRGQLVTKGDQQMVVVPSVLTFEWDRDVRKFDRITVAGGGAFEVVNVRKWSASIALRVECVEV